jgi:hypothetical protein
VKLRAAWAVLVLTVACEHRDNCTDEQAQRFGDRCGAAGVESTYGQQDQFGREIAGRVRAGFKLLDRTTVRVDASEPRLQSDNTWVATDDSVVVTNDFGFYRVTNAPLRYDLTMLRDNDVFMMRHLALRAIDPPFGDDQPPRAYTGHVELSVEPPPAPGDLAAFFVSGDDALSVTGDLTHGADVMVGGFSTVVTLHVVTYTPQTTLTRPTGYGKVDIRVQPAIAAPVHVVLAPVTDQRQFGIQPILGPGVVETDTELTIDFGVRTSFHEVTVINPQRQVALLQIPNARYIIRTHGTKGEGSSDSGIIAIDPLQAVQAPLLYAPPTLVSPADLAFVDGPLVAEGRGTHEHVLDPDPPGSDRARIRIVTTDREVVVPDLSRLGVPPPHGAYKWTVRRWPDVATADALSGPDARVAQATSLSEVRRVAFR